MNTTPKGNIIALLGPTNTGKTHTAVERMLAHSSGIIGLPLRLLAREVYDRVVGRIGAGGVALITGEEKIIPKNTKYWVCTVEAMPTDKCPAFLAVDEIQLCGDVERGHIFTNRLLHARGHQETIFMGSDTIAGFIRRLVSDVTIQRSSRFSTLMYSGHKKLSRMPQRAAVIAFSTGDVYAIAELLRRQRGGAAVVLGALSPRTRNAQVALYQAGDVNYLVATDAIGMGLNMDLHHVAFAHMRKYDGRKRRPLTPAEVGQIAGRAGRHMDNGTFGITGNLPPMDPHIVSRVEGHNFQPLTHLFWRNSKLDYGSIPALTRSLEHTPRGTGFIRAKQATDYVTLKALADDRDIQAATNDRGMVALLWDVCSIPDFRKSMTDDHVQLLRDMYIQLSRLGKLSEEWLNAHLNSLDRVDGDIDSLTQRLAHIRTWTYVSHRSHWLSDPDHWQGRAHGIESRISDALHEGLMKQFVDRRTSVLLNRLQERKVLMGEVKDDGEVRVEGQLAGYLQGFRFNVAEIGSDPQAVRKVMTAARNALAQTIESRVTAVEKSNHNAIVLDGAGQLRWENHTIGRLIKGDRIMDPRVKVYDSEVVDTPHVQRLEKRLQEWTRIEVHAKLKPLFKIERSDLEGTPRGIAFQIVEALGVLPRNSLGAITKSLTPQERQSLKDLGIRLGFKTAFVAEVLKPAPARLRMILWAVFGDKLGIYPPPPLGLMSFSIEDGTEEGFYNAAGYRTCGARAVRVDMLERLAFEAHKLMEQGPFIAPPEMAATIGCKRDELPVVLEGLGYRAERLENPDDTQAPAQYRFAYAPKHHLKAKRSKVEPAGLKSTVKPDKKSRLPGKAKQDDHMQSKPYHKPNRTPKSCAAVKIDPDNPFAKLADLKLK